MITFCFDIIQKTKDVKSEDGYLIEFIFLTVRLLLYEF